MDGDVRPPEGSHEGLEKYEAGTFPVEFWDSEGKVYDIFAASLNLSVKVFNKLGFPYVTLSCFMYKKDVFEKVEGFNEELITMEDIDLAKRASGNFEFSFIPKKIYTSCRRIKKKGWLNYMKEGISCHINYFLKGKSNPSYWEG